MYWDREKNALTLEEFCLQQVNDWSDPVEELELVLERYKRVVIGAMRSIANGQETAANTLFNGRYWAQDLFGLYALGRWGEESWEGRPGRFVSDANLARADARPVRDDARYTVTPPAAPEPYRGYFFRAVDRGGMRDGVAPLYGICAFPAEYGLTGRLTFIIDEEATVYSKDLGGQPVERWPTSAEKATSWESVER